MPAPGFHYAIVAGVVCSQAVLRKVRGTQRLRFMLAAAWPQDAHAETLVDQMRPETLELTCIVERMDGDMLHAKWPMRIPITVEPPLAYELHPLCEEGVAMLVCGPLSSEQRFGLSFLEIVAQEAYLL